MTTQKKEMTWGYLGLVLVVVSVFSLVIGTIDDTINSAVNEGYRQGQIDALNGKWKYEVVVKADTSYIAKPE